jgi:hypothetical protein
MRKSIGKAGILNETKAIIRGDLRRSHAAVRTAAHSADARRGSIADNHK